MTATSPPVESQVTAATPDHETAEPMVLRRDVGGVCTLTMNRPSAYNALSIEMMTQMITHLEALDIDPAIKVVVIEGAGKGFCAGHDLKELKANPEKEFRALTFATCGRMMMAVTNLRQPVIAKVHGIATAAGCQLVATCDLALSTTDARFGTPGVNIGLFCSTPLVALSRAVHQKHAMELLLTGQLASSERAAEIGLINRAVAAEDLDEEVDILARMIADKSGLVLKTGKEAFYHQANMDLEEAYAYCAEVMTDNMSFNDAEEGIAAFIEKRKPTWTDS